MHIRSDIGSSLTHPFGHPGRFLVGLALALALALALSPAFPQGMQDGDFSSVAHRADDACSFSWYGGPAAMPIRLLAVDAGEWNVTFSPRLGEQAPVGWAHARRDSGTPQSPGRGCSLKVVLEVRDIGKLEISEVRFPDRTPARSCRLVRNGGTVVDAQAAGLCVHAYRTASQWEIR